MPLSQALRKLIEAGLLTALTPRPLPQPIPAQFRMDLHCAYHQGPGHETDRCTALRHAIQDLIDQGLVHLGQPSVTTNPLPTHTTHAVPPPAGGIHFLDFDETDDHVHMLSWDDPEPEPIMPAGIYETSGVTLEPQMPASFRLVPKAASVQAPTSEPLTFTCYSVQAPYILIPDVEEVQAPHRDDPQTPDVQYILRGGRVVRQPPPAAARPVEGTSASQEEVRAEDDEILRQLQSTQARISIWSLLASSSTHRDALTRALSQIRVDTTTTPEGLIHMMTVGRATCIVFSDDDLPPEGSDHTRPLYISVGCSGRRVPSVLLDNGSALNVCPLATAITLGYAPSDFGPSTQTVRAYDSTRREVMGTLEIELLIGPATFVAVFQVLRIPTSFNLLLGRPWIHRAGAIPSSLHQKVKFIHDGQVVVVQSVGDMFITAEPVLEISHTDDDLFLTGFTFDEVQTVEIEDFCRDFVAMSFDRHGSTVVLDICGACLIYPTWGWVDVSMDRASSSLFLIMTYHLGSGSSPMRPIISTWRHHPGGELQRLVQQLRLRDGAPGPSTSVLIAPSSPDRTSLMTLCFPDEIDEHGTLAEIEETIQPGLTSPFDLFGVSFIEIVEEIQTAPALEIAEDAIVFDDLIDSHVGIVEGASDFVDPPLHLTFCRGSSPVLTLFPIFLILMMRLHSMTQMMTHLLFPIRVPLIRRVSPAVGDTEIVDFGTADQPRELRIGSDLSTDERDSSSNRLSRVETIAPSLELAGERGDSEATQCGVSISGRVPRVAGQCRPCSKKDGKVRVCVDFRDLNKGQS
ncbi:hypothetical protein CK203_055767 [Vitis vinifera]|uniref:Uncharacterized protein n=1 Tax=Vitis vinifera TaxID=29760 RepID=A0A438H232_VITVI|nr:hypothetical protein CK203_055767 [Vitis vinifera]